MKETIIKSEIDLGGINSTNDHPFAELPFKSYWVFLSGKEIIGRKRLIKPSNILCLLASVLWLVLGVSGIVWSLKGGVFAVPIYLISTILIVGGARYMVGTNIHMLAHKQMFKSELLNFLMGELLTTVCFIQSYQFYKDDHLRSHHGKNFGSLKDGDALAIVQLGFTSGKTRSQLWLNLIKRCIDPMFHLHFLKGRFKENLVICPDYRKFMTLGWFGILGCINYYFGTSIIIHTYIIPVIFLCQIAALVQLVTEHVWISTGLSSHRCHILLANGRYCGVKLPHKNGSNIQYIIDFALWMTRMFFIELPARVLFFQGTLPSHDWHHRYGNSKEWADSAMQRELMVEAEIKEFGQSSYQEVWGFFEILDRVFVNISKSSPYPEMEGLPLDSRLNYGDIK
ncbi:fatty acid desaturase [Nostoc commune]|uniref:fatty acid desaturase n=1 Tax=Nostoc commune TaxID=1178 RepID=UPI0018C52D5F|nr:fatty acid desaturase [Nostoc commune]MBG1262380.1 hypothetical protein [Nostoc commune BAE]